MRWLPPPDSPKNCCQLCIMLPIIVVVGLLVSIFAPIAALFALPVLGCQATYRAIRAGRAKDRTKNGSGVPLSEELGQGGQPLYMSGYSTYSPADAERLRQEIVRLDQLASLRSALKWARGASKCLLPIGGWIWALRTEIEGGGSIELGCAGCQQHYGHWTAREALDWHLARLNASA